MHRCSEIDFVRFFLIIAVVLIHIVNFGNMYPEVKSVILSFLMPTFLFITGYLVNIEKSKKEYAMYLIRLFLPYLIMVISYSVMSFYLPVHDRLTEMSISAIARKVFITSIGPYWFLQTMIVCGIIYYICFRFLHSRIEKMSILSVFCFSLIIIADNSQILSIKAIHYYFMGALLRQTRICFNSLFPKSPYAILPVIFLLCHKEMRDWSCISIPIVIYFLISFINWLESVTCTYSAYKHILFVGANTLPIYLFHPIFTMLAKVYLPLFVFDPSGIIYAILTVIIATIGSLLIAYVMDHTRLSYILGKPRILGKLK